MCFAISNTQPHLAAIVPAAEWGRGRREAKTGALIFL
jgi:hypothetical protein